MGETNFVGKMLQGHFPYYGGVIGNVRCRKRFRYEVVRLWRKWFGRRRRGGQWTWDRLNRLLGVLVLPWPRGWVAPCSSAANEQMARWRKTKRLSRENLVDDLAMHIGQAVVTAAVAEG
jgi:hypothetical protein